MVIFTTKNTALTINKCYPLFDIGKHKDNKGFNTIYYLHLFGVSFNFEVVHYRPK